MTEETLKVGDVVMLRSGSPHMVLVEVPKAGKFGWAKATYWDQARNEGATVRVQMSAIETPEARIKREARLQKAIHGTRHILLPEDCDETASLVMVFDSPADKAAFLQGSFEQGVPDTAKVLH